MPGDNISLKILEVLHRIAVKRPSLRVGQIIGNAVPSDVATRVNNDFYYLPDADMLTYLQDYEKKHI